MYKQDVVTAKLASITGNALSFFFVLKWVELAIRENDGLAQCRMVDRGIE